MRPGRVQGDDAVADRARLDAGTDVGDRARREVPDDVRHGPELRPGAMEQVAALDADRFDVDDHVPVRALGIGDVLVAQNVRTAVLVDHRRSHSGATLLEAPTLSRLVAGVEALAYQRWHVPGGGPGACGTSSAHARMMRAGS